MPRKASPLSSTSIGNLLGAIFLFTTCYVFCLKRLVLFASLLVSLPQSSLMYTPFERAIHDLEFARILYVLHLYLLSLIVLLIVLHLNLFERNNFCSSASLRSFRAWWWICFEETIDLSCFTQIILRVVNSMVICLKIIYLVFKICETFF